MYKLINDVNTYKVAILFAYHFNTATVLPTQELHIRLTCRICSHNMGVPPWWDTANKDKGKLEPTIEHYFNDVSQSILLRCEMLLRIFEISKMFHDYQSPWDPCGNTLKL